MSDTELAVGTLFSSKGLVIVVTGGGTGIGFAIAKALEYNGAERVYIVGRHIEVLESAAKQSKFGRITPLVCDVTSKSQLQAIAEQISRESGRVDVLINNAGAMVERHEKLAVDSVEALQEAFWTEDPDKWAQQFELNVTGAFFTTVAFLKLLKQANQYWSSVNPDNRTRFFSQVITVTGISAHHRAMVNFAGYGASKAALHHLMELLSTVLAPLDIRFNILAPGLFPSGITAGKGAMDDQNRHHLGPVPRSLVPQGRAADDQDIAGAILFLCGRGGWYCNGTEIIVDGGRLSFSNKL